MLKLHLFIFQIIPCLFSLPTQDISPTPASIFQLPDIPLKIISKLAGKKGRANLAQTCTFFKDMVYEKLECGALAEMFSASTLCPENLPLRNQWLLHLEECPVTEKDFPEDLVEVKGLPYQPPFLERVSPLYRAIKLKQWDVANAMLHRKGPLKLYAVRTNGTQFQRDILNSNPVWAALELKQYSLAQEIITSPSVKVYRIVNNNVDSQPLSKSSLFIPSIITHFCNDPLLKTDNGAVSFCLDMLNQFQQDSSELPTCSGIGNHPQWSWEVFQKGLIQPEWVSETVRTSVGFAYEGKTFQNSTKYGADYCSRECECAVVNGIAHGIGSSGNIEEKEEIITAWIQKLHGVATLREHRRTLLRILMRHGYYSQVLKILRSEPPHTEAWIDTYYSLKMSYEVFGFPAKSNKKYGAQFSYDEILLLDAIFYGNEAIIQHYLESSSFLSPDFLIALNVNLKSCSGKQNNCVYCSNLEAPSANIKKIEDFVAQF